MPVTRTPKRTIKRKKPVKSSLSIQATGLRVLTLTQSRQLLRDETGLRAYARNHKYTVPALRDYLERKVRLAKK